MEGFETRLSDFLKKLEQETTNIRNHLKVLKSGAGRTVHFNSISESSANIKGIAKILMRINLEEELVKEELQKKLDSVINRAIKLTEEENV